MLVKQYLEEVQNTLDLVFTEEYENIDEAARLIANSIKMDGLVHLFGCGHSHILVEDLFYRAGGIVPVNPILDSSIMLHEGAVKSSKVEQLSGIAEVILDNYAVKKDEIIIVISTSGVNSLPIEMAMAAKKKELKVIAITSSKYFSTPSRHVSGQLLKDVADIVIDNHIVKGDAIVDLPGHTIKMASGSTAVGSVLLNMLMVRVAEILVKDGIEPPIFLSGNVAGGHEYNQKFIEKYKHRIKHL